VPTEADTRSRAREIARYLDVPRSVRPPIWREVLPDWRLVGTLHELAPSRTSSSSRTVVIVPGFLATDVTSSVLASALRRSGHRVHRAGLGTTNGCSEILAARLLDRLEHCSARADSRPLTLIGHSRGGQIAKVAATRRPDLVESVVTLGTPLTDQWGSHLSLKLLIATLSELARRGVDVGGCRDRGCPFGACSTGFTRDLVAAPAAHVDFTSIYSRRDGVVQWETCLHPAARHVEVRSSHLAMGVHPQVVREVLRALDG
jgi:pimeloyl-ACP methyl ester carboxylesterase